MLRISALNDSLCSQDSQGSHYVKEATKEAKEAETYALYNKALGLLRHGERANAESVFRDLIDHDFLQEAIDLLEERGKDAVHPGLQLLYSIYKNLASMATQKKDFSTAMDWYLEAVKIDNSEVTVWYKVGVTALKIEDFYLAKTAFEEGLECNPKHWPCLDNIIPVMFSLNNYAECLYFISKAFEMDVYYEKGHAIRNKIFQDQPCLKSDFEEFFMYCDKEMSDVKIDPDVEKQYVEEALQMRYRRQELSKPPDPVRLKFPDKLREYSWQCVGETLIDLYDKAVNSKPIISLCLTMNMPNYDGVESEKEALLEKAKKNNVDSDSVDKGEVKVHFEVAGESAMEVDNLENKQFVSKETVQKENKDEATPMDVEVTADKDKVKTEQENGSNTGNDDIIEKSKELLNDKTDILESSSNEKMEISEDIVEIKEKPKSGEDVNDEASTDSVLEAAKLAHRLIDSLSPNKQPDNNPKNSEIVKSTLTFQDQGENKSEIDKPELKTSIASIEHVPDTSKPSESQPTLTKSASLGFSVSHLNTESKEDNQNPTIDQSTVQEIKEKNVIEIDSTDCKVADDNQKSTNHNIKPSLLTPPINGNQPDSVPIIDLTEMDSDNEQPQKNPADKQLLSSNATTNQSIQSSCMIPTSSGSVITSPIPVTKSSNITNSNNSVSQGNAVSTPVISAHDSQYKDHAYSKASSQQGSVAMVTSPQGHMMMVNSIPVTQPLIKNVDSNVVNESPMIDLDLDDLNLASKRNQKKRKISLATEEIMMYGKRRSTRVRNPGKKKEEVPANVKDLLLAFLPSSLKTVQDEDGNTTDSLKDDSILMEKSILDENIEEEPAKPSYTIWDETDDVKSFLKGLHAKNAGMVDIMNRYLRVVAEHWKLKWTESLCSVYINLFKRARRHLYMPNPFDTADEPDIFQEMALICLAFSELQLDHWLFERAKVIGSQQLSPRGKTSELLPVEDIPKYFDEDIMFLTMLCGQTDRLGEHWIDHCVRVYWMKSKYAILLGKMEEAIYSFERLKEYFEYMKEESIGHQVVVPNCRMENVITLDLVTSQHDLLQKSHCVEETQRLYDAEEFERVVEILLQTFSQPQHKAKVLKVEASERQSQLSLLNDAMFKTRNNGRSLIWGEESLNEAYQEYKTTNSMEEKSSWLKTMIETLDYLQRVLDREITAVRSLPSLKLVRMTQNLIRMIDKNMSLPETATEMVIDTVTPWALLYQLIKHEEDKIESMRLKEAGASEDLDDAIPSSQMLLNIAHDYLGGRSWCTRSDGSLLLFFMSVLKEKMEVESENQEEFQQSFEQCVYCLFGHPNKKAKAKNLQDHNVTGITLQWDHAVMVFDYFKPKSVPEFDGYKSETISSELEVLFKRIIPLVPESCKAKVLRQEEVFCYIDGSKDTPPALKEEGIVKSTVLKDIYYLLGDYYLKNKEFLKAVKFYMMDLCVNPSRLDSWAGMALARMSQLESRLTSAELKMDTPIYKKSIAALRCFKRATEIEDSNPKLWIEYGTLAYQLHGHASKQIKWKKWFNMDKDFVDIAVESKREMVQTALHCFRQASEWNDEAWLHNYMIGKCLEKMRKPINDVLPYYFQALSNLHDDKAKYPKKIIYATYTTPHLAVEALEMYYRIHAVILKYLMKHKPDSEEIDYKFLVTTLVDAAFSHFVLRVEKGQEAKLERESASSADESSSSELSTPLKKTEQGSTDHNYFRQKSQDSTGVTPIEGSVQQSMGVRPSNINTEESTCVGLSRKIDDKVEGSIDHSKSRTVVTTLELHAEQSSSGEGVTLTTSRTEYTTDHNVDKIPNDKSTGVTPTDTSQSNEKPSEIEKAVSKGHEGQNQVGENKDKNESVESTVKSIIDYIEDMVVKTIESSVKTETKELEKIEMEESGQKSEISGDITELNTKGSAENSQDKTTSGSIPGSKTPNMSTKKEEMLESLLKLSNQDLHKELMDRCRKAFELCLHRFPTHYKSHYRLAQIYFKCEYFKDMKKAHHIMLAGSVNWKQLNYMPCQAMFGERKMSKFFQGIWKIPIDEIDRAGSFPSHLNRCIDLALHILKEEGDCQVLHQVHLQLNRQPEPGKKYLRDAEKKYYALTSHRFSLDAAETRIQEMKTVTDAEQRHKFLLAFYKIWEHGVHKLNKHVERTNKLLAEAYRVVVRKLETLPPKMLLDQAIRYCKHLMSQKSKSDKDTISQSGESTHDGKGKPKPGVKLSTAKEAIKAIPVMNLENIMKVQDKSNAVTTTDDKQTDKNNQDKSSIQTIEEQKSETKDKSEKVEDAIVIDSSDESDHPDHETGKETINVSSKPDAIKPTSDEKENKGTDVKAPTVKIKMGLLQAVKRLKPNPVGDDGKKEESSTDDKMDTDIEAVLSQDDGNDVPEPSNDESEDSSSSSESSSDSSSEDDNGDENDDKNDGDDDSNNDDQSDDSASSSSSEDESDNLKSKVSIKDLGQADSTFKPPDIKLTISSSDDDAESSDNSQEIDLVSSEDNQGKDDDTDYKASEDEDVVMASDDEFKSIGRAVVPSPPHDEEMPGDKMEVLVEKVPDFDPLNFC